MALNKAYNQYKENSIFTSTPEELTLMLYNGLIRFMMLAKSSIEARDIEKASNAIIRAQDIIIHFRSTLDMKYEVSGGLDAIYDYMYRRLVDANVRKDADILEEVLGYARELRDTWAQAMKLSKHPQPPRIAAQE